jgi:DMSO reductase family type II enzyme molybdopterin subunit
VVLTPDYNATALHADLWLNPKVGTDAALALAMARVIIDEGLLDANYVKEQTDLPFLVRSDTGRFLREGDLRKGGRDDLFYFWDGRHGGPVRAPATKGDWWFRKLDLGEREPALEGTFRVTLYDGHEVTVRPVFELLRERLASYTPERAAAISGIAADTIRALARDFGHARRALILASYGACKHFHSDLLQRALILLVALTGNQGKRGGGLRVAAWWSLSGFETLAAGYEPPFLAEQLLRLYRPPARTMEFFISDHMRENYLMTPTLLWLYVHGGLAKTHVEIEPDLKEALRQGWMPVYPKPGKDPRVLICTGGNPLRRWPAPHLLEEQLWPKLGLIVSINFRMSTTALKSDLVLPAAGYYEKPGVKYAQSYLPYVVVGEKAVEPLGEAKSEWEIFGLLARRVQERAVERGVRPVQDPLGLEHDLRALYRSWSADGELPVENEERALDYIIGRSEPTRGLTWREAREPGRYTPANGVASDIAPGQTVAPSQWFVEKKEPWPTLTGRQQFFLDHPWFMAAGEDLPTYKELPAIGGPYPLRLTGGHTRWSIHALWRDDERLLQLQRGEPVAYMNVADAAARKIRDHDRVRVYNDVGSFRILVKRSPAVQPGQVIVYHAWEPYQFADWQSSQNPLPSPIKPLHLVGDYAQIHYRTGLAAPCYAPRGTSVEVEKA